MSSNLTRGTNNDHIMFNRYYIGGDTTNTRCEVNLQQPSTGFIQKSNPVSRFIRFQRGSEIEKQLFPSDPTEVPKLSSRIYNKCEEEVIILQICIFGQDYMLAEYVFKKDLK